MKNTRMNSVQISTNFIDLNYADDLHENLKDYPDVNIISGKYEDTIVDLLLLLLLLLIRYDVLHSLP
jgi:hypothetical protein